MRDARAKSSLYQSNPIAFFPVLLLSLITYDVCLDPWLPQEKKPLNLKPILLVTMFSEKQRVPDFAMKSQCNNLNCNSIGNRKIRTRRNDKSVTFVY